MSKRDWFTIPNILSYFRLILIPYFVYFYVTAVTEEDYWLATGILVLSGITDAADGFIARHFDQGTKIGQLLDPIADKLTQIAVVSVLMLEWPVFGFLLLLFIIKEGYMFVENIRLYRKKITLDGSKWYGKIATIVFYLTMFIAVFFPDLSNVTVTFLVILASTYQLLAFFYYAKLFKYLHKSEGN
ncbi:MAG: CDP-alcohol phosphatidyltransferase family protein [Alkalibacterium sp.]|uniref:CDP-alcohol phosphatidyltransferase family protein n=1 Tax=Alkalibacterium sp. TaxID=1872447 RepID=UPI003970611B